MKITKTKNIEAIKDLFEKPLLLVEDREIKAEKVSELREKGIKVFKFKNKVVKKYLKDSSKEEILPLFKSQRFLIPLESSLFKSMTSIQEIDAYRYLKAKEKSEEDLKIPSGETKIRPGLMMKIMEKFCRIQLVKGFARILEETLIVKKDEKPTGEKCLVLKEMGIKSVFTGLKPFAFVKDSKILYDQKALEEMIDNINDLKNLSSKVSSSLISNKIISFTYLKVLNQKLMYIVSTKECFRS